MNKNLILILIVLIVAGGIGYKLMVKSNPKVQAPVPQVENSKTRVKSSLKQMLGMGKSVSCEMSANQAEGIVSGKVNVSGSRMMGDFKMSDESGKMMDTYMINDGEFTYIWSSETPQGTKIKNNAVTSGKSDQPQNNLDQDKEVDMECTNWSPVSGSFIPPSDIDFIDMSSMMKAIINEKSDQPVTTQKSICDAVSDPQAKAICLQQVGN